MSKAADLRKNPVFNPPNDGQFSQPIILRAENIAVQASGSAADIAVIRIPKNIRRFIIPTLSVTDAIPAVTVVKETGATQASARFKIYDAVAAGGNLLVDAFAGNSSATAALQPAASAGASPLISSSGILVIRQTTNSSNAGTASFYVVIWPLC